MPLLCSLLMLCWGIEEYIHGATVVCHYNRRRVQRHIWQYIEMFFKNVLDFPEAACFPQTLCVGRKKRGTSIHVTGLHPCLTDKSQLLYQE